MSHPRVTIGLILFKNEHYLKLSLGSLAAQDYANHEILVLDQSPNGEAYEYIKKEMPDVFAKIKIEKGENKFHSGGHNTLIQKMNGEWYFSASVDMWYPPDLVSKAMIELEKPENKTIGSASPKLMRWNFKTANTNLEVSKTNQIDSCGIGLTQSHRFFDRGQGEEDKGQYDQKAFIFGASAAAGFYKKSALETMTYVNPNGSKEYFDETLHYKNDCDLAYRLQWAGFPCLFIPHAKVWHDRQASTQSKKSTWTQENSYFGQLVTLRKNWSADYSFTIKLKTGLRQAALWVYAHIREHSLLHAYTEFKKRIPPIDQKHSAMPRRIPTKEMEKLMSN